MNKHQELGRPFSEAVTETWGHLTADLGAATHTGRIRTKNEDSYLLMQFGRSLERLATNLDEPLIQRNYDLKGYGLLVADGMGGMAAGEVASGLALAKVVELLVETPDWILDLKNQKDARTVLKRMSQRFFQIDNALKDIARDDDALEGMGTTLTVAGTLDRDLIIGHIGDSRAYLLRGQTFKQLTTDHTLAQALIDAGVATSDDPASRSMRHVLTAAIGSLDDRIEPQVQRLRVTGGDQLLLCTDGLTAMVDDEIIANVLRRSASAQDACQELIDLALGAGGSDNVTVLLARFQEQS